MRMISQIGSLAGFTGVFTLALAQAGCTGILGDSGSGAEDLGTIAGGGLLPGERGPASTAGSTLDACEPGPLANMPTRLLTKPQLKNMLGRVFPGADTSALDHTPPDDLAGGFVVGTSIVDELRLDGLSALAMSVSEHVKANFSALMPGCTDESEDACADAFVVKFGRMLFRRAVTTDEKTELLALYRETGAGEAGLGYLVRALLLSGPALYHVEAHVDEAVAIGGTDMATKLALLLWNDTPDDALLTAAEAGELDTAEGVRVRAEAMLNDPRASAAIGRFYSEWLGFLERAEDPELSEAAALELSAFLEAISLDPERSFSEFYTSNEAYLTSETAAAYGVPGDFSTPRWTTLDPSERAGLMTRLSFLLDTGPQTSPTVRGLHVRERLLCQQLPAVPGDVNFPPFQEELTPRQFVEYHLQEPSCAGCHEYLDPLGLGFEQYDQTGRYRTAYVQTPDEVIDPSGAVSEVSGQPTDADGEFSDLLDLSQRLGESQTAQNCFTEKWYRFAMGRALSGSDTCELEQMNEAFSGGGAHPRDYLFALVTSPGFRRREAQE